MHKLLRFSLDRCATPYINIQTVLRIPSSQKFCSGDSKTDTTQENKLSGLLKSLKTSDSLRQQSSKNLKLAKPGFSKGIKRGKDGRPSKGLADPDLEKEVINATKSVAKLAKTERKQKRTESELLKKLKALSEETNDAKDDNLVAGESLLGEMKIERTKMKQSKQKIGIEENKEGQKADKKELSMEQLAFLQKRAKLRRAAENAKQEEDGSSIDLNSGTPLGIFSGPILESSDAHMLKTWRLCQKRELEILSTPSPRNALEEMVLLTKQGKLWHFPVDNEQGLDYSGDPFYNHVFLEHHLDPWCPKMGPVRHFMEVVCLGLSKNPYVTSQKKLDTILWFKDYFEKPENNEILVHSGFWEEN